MTSFGLRPVIRRPTRVTSSTATLLDHIWVSDSAVVEAGIIRSFLTDHFLTYICIHIGETASHLSGCNFINRRSFNDSNKALFGSELSSIDWDFVRRAGDVDAAFDLFFDTFDCLFNKHFPVKQQKVRNIDIEKPYVTRELKALIKRKHQLEKLALKRPITYLDEYKQTRNRVNKLIKTAKKNFYSNEINSAECKRKSWKVMNEILGRNNRKSLPSHVVVGQSEILDDFEIATSFNDHFAGVGDRLAAAISTNIDPMQYMSDELDLTMNFDNVTECEVNLAVNNMKNCSPGIDGIPMQLIKLNIQSLSPILTYLFDSSLRSGVFPESLKKGRVSCIYKKGNRHCLDNYRPISVITSFSKILEKLASDRLTKYVEENNILSPWQFGFRKNRSTELAIHNLVATLQDAFERGEVGVGVFMDLTKAFDCMDRDILYKKLHRYGIRGKELDWFKSYFLNRKQCTVWGETYSSFADLKWGVIQGGNISPVLFDLYINDLVSVPQHCSTLLFADDTSLVATSRNSEELFTRVNSDLTRVCQWFDANKLTLNASKTHYVIFARSRRVLDSVRDSGLRVGSVAIDRHVKSMFLGVLIDELLTWQPHVQLVCNKLAKYVPILRNIRNCIDVRALITLYNSLIYPNITYCNSVWGACLPTYRKPLEILQRKIVRVIAGISYRDPTADCFKTFKFLNIQNIYVYFTCIFVYRAFNCIVPCDFFTASSNTDHNVRSNDSLQFIVPRIISEHYRQCIKYSGPKQMNSIPVKIKSTTQISLFKSKLKHYLLN